MNLLKESATINLVDPHFVILKGTPKFQNTEESTKFYESPIDKSLSDQS